MLHYLLIPFEIIIKYHRTNVASLRSMLLREFRMMSTLKWDVVHKIPSIYHGCLFNQISFPCTLLPLVHSRLSAMRYDHKRKYCRLNFFMRIPFGKRPKIWSRWFNFANFPSENYFFVMIMLINIFKYIL